MAASYDRELIAQMLEGARRGDLHQFSVESIERAISQLRAADNADAAGVHTARRLPPDGIHTCSYQCDQPECIRAQRDDLAAQAERDAAEIVRLRGEVCSCPSGDGSLRWPCKAHPPEPIAPAEAKDPAPAMPNGVEGLMQLARNWCLAWGEWAHDADPGGAKENAAEAALRAALTTALAKPPAEAFDPSIHPIPGEGQQPAMPNGVDGLAYAQRLAVAIWSRNYREVSPQWEVCEDLMGVLSQIDNMVSGMSAADNRDAAGVDSEEDAYVIERMGKLLAEIAVIVNGPEPDMTRWSYPDLPEKVRALKTAPDAATVGEAVARRPQFIVDRMVSAFLSWRLPQDFRPDNGVAFAAPGNPSFWPSGTNLFNADQAKAMVEHMLGPAIARDRYTTEEEGDAFTDGYFTGADEALATPPAAPVQAAHPAAGDKVLELVAKWRREADRLRAINAEMDPDGKTFRYAEWLREENAAQAGALTSCARALEAALQHRGDSRGGEV